jgi:hypothetical protein
VTTRRTIEDKVPAPYVIDSLRPQAVARILGIALCSLFLALLTYFQAFCFPNAIHAFKADLKPLKAKQPGHLAITKSRTLPSQCM